MTIRQVYEATLIELAKVQAPALKLYEFNYLFNKAINSYVNKVYNFYDVNQQTTDDLRVLKSTAYLTPVKFNRTNQALHSDANSRASSYLSRAHSSIQSLHGATYEVELPIDYLHLLNCICIYYVAKQKDCWDAGSYIEVPATRLTADSWGQIVTDIYNRPSPMKPYYYIHNQNTQVNNSVLPTSPITSVSESGMPNGTDMTGIYNVTNNSDLPTIYVIQNEIGSGSETSVGWNIDGQWKIFTNISWNPTTKTLSRMPKDTNELCEQATQDQIKKFEESPIYSISSYKDPDKTIGWSKDGVLQNQDNASNFQRTFKLDLNGDGTPDTNVSLVEKPIGIRASNPSNVRMEIRYGKDDTVFQLKEVQVDYIKSPQHIRLTQEQIDLTEDTSQIMEFPDYVNQEIINELVHFIMLRSGDGRITNQISLDTSIARPAQQQTTTAKAD